MLVKWGGGIVDGRGSIAGTTFSRNKSGAYARARVKPVNPQSQRQSDIRAIMSTVSKDWYDALSQAQRDDWAVYGANVPENNKLGEVIRLSGFNQYVKSNVASINAALPAILGAPSVFTKPGEDSSFAVTASEATQQLSVTFDDTRDWVDEDDAGYIVQMGIPQNDSIEFFDGPWRHAGVIEGDSVTAPTTPATIAVPFPVVEDQKIFCRARILRADGRLGDWFRDNVICGA